MFRILFIAVTGLLGSTLGLGAKTAARPVWFEPTPGGGYLTRQGAVELALQPRGFRWSFASHLTIASTVEAAFAGQQPSHLGRLVGEQPLGVWANDLTAHRHAARIPLYQRARYRDLYPGIDLVFHGRQLQLEFDFELAAGADPSQIRLNLRGHQGLIIAPDGSLTIDSAGGQIHWHRPVVTQAGVRLEGQFRLLAYNSVGFVVGPHNHRQPLVIDPVLSYSTYFGASGNDGARAIATDLAGNVYIAGLTTSQNLPVSRTAAQPAYGGQASAINSGDTFVAKFTPTGAVAFVTYLGGSGDDTPGGIAVDPSGNVYIAGMTTSRNFPVTPNAPQRNYAGAGGGQLFPAGDAYVVKLNSCGCALC